MKKKILLISLMLSMMFCISGCSNVINIDEVLESPNTKIIDFEVVDKNFYNAILVDKNTKVMYYWNMSNTGGFTPIYNEDGSLKLYEE